MNKSYFLVPTSMVLNGGVRLFEFQTEEPYVIKFNRILGIYRENGFYKYHEDSSMNRPNDDRHVKTSSSMLFFILLVVFAIGVSLSCLTYLLEVLFHSELKVTEEDDESILTLEKSTWTRGIMRELKIRVTRNAWFLGKSSSKLPYGKALNRRFVSLTLETRV